MQLIIDRLDGEWAVCEYDIGKTLDLPRSLLPADVKEGDSLRIIVEQDATRNRKEYAEELRRKLFDRK